MAVSLHVLLVDDNLVFLSAAVRCLVVDPCVAGIACVHSGKAALAYIAHSRPDLVVVSLSMEGSSGLDIVRAIKTHPNPPHVVLTALDDNVEYRAAAHGAGADGFAAKTEFALQVPALIADLCFGEHPPVAQ